MGDKFNKDTSIEMTGFEEICKPDNFSTDNNQQDKLVSANQSLSPENDKRPARAEDARKVNPVGWLAVKDTTRVAETQDARRVNPVGWLAVKDTTRVAETQDGGRVSPVGWLAVKDTTRVAETQDGGRVSPVDWLAVKDTTRVGGVRDAGRVSPVDWVVHLEEIELMDMGTVSRTKQSESSNVRPSSPECVTALPQTKGEFECKQRKIEQLNLDPSQDSESGNLSSSSPSMNDTEPMHKSPGPTEECKSLLSVPGRIARHSPSKTQSRSSLETEQTKSNTSSPEQTGKTASFDDEDDISMASLSELLGAVRQYAKEIHEIYAPIKEDEEERTRKRNERIEKRKTKNVNKFSLKKSVNQPTTSTQYEVRVDIHALEERLQEKMRDGRHRKPRHELVPPDKSGNSLTTDPIASLHVENEKLSSTWPRGQRRSPTREHFFSDITLDKQRHARPSDAAVRPNLPEQWGETSSLKQEKEIFQKAFHRLSKPNDSLSGRNIQSAQQKIATRPRQSVVDVPKGNRKLHENVLPTICIIPPLSEHRRRSVESRGFGVLPSTTLDIDIPLTVFPHTRKDVRSHSEVIPAGTVVVKEPGEGRQAARQSKNGGAGVKSSSKAGLRRRSVDQGLGQSAVPLEKY